MSLSAQLIADLAHGTAYSFSEWPNPAVPVFGAGVYTIWHHDGRFIYVGMSGRGITADTARRTTPQGNYTRLQRAVTFTWKSPAKYDRDRLHTCKQRKSCASRRRSHWRSRSKESRPAVRHHEQTTSAERYAIFWLRSTAGSPKSSTRAI